MISGISGTKRTVRNRGVCKERLDCTLIRQLWIWPRFLRVPNKSAPNPALSVGVTRVQRTRFHWHTKHKFLNSVFVLGAQNERKILRKMMSYQTSSKRSPPFCLLIGARKTQVLWHQSEARTAATIWNWSGTKLSPGALLAVLYFSFVPYFPACLDFPSPPLSAPGSPRMWLGGICRHNLFYIFLHVIYS